MIEALPLSKVTNYKIDAYRNKCHADGMIYSSNYYIQIAEIVETSIDRMATELYDKFKTIVNAYPAEAAKYGFNLIEEHYINIMRNVLRYYEDIIVKEFSQPHSSPFASGSEYKGPMQRYVLVKSLQWNWWVKF